MFIALDVHYGESFACGASVGFQDPRDEKPAFVIVERFEGAASAYEPGNFKKRELPYLEQLVRLSHQRCTNLSAAIIDGYVWLGEGRPGLGFYLHEAIAGRMPIVGVAKTRFRGAPAGEVERGGSTRPLFVTAIGIDRGDAERLVQSMHGDHRIPTLVGWADRAARSP